MTELEEQMLEFFKKQNDPYTYDGMTYVLRTIRQSLDEIKEIIRQDIEERRARLEAIAPYEEDHV